MYTYSFLTKHYSKGCCSPSWCLSLQQRSHVLKALFFLQKTGHIVSVYIPYDIQVFYKLLGGWSSTLQQYGCCHFVVGQMHKRTWKTTKSSMVMSWSWLLFVFGGRRIMTPPTYCTSLFQREELCPGSELLEGRSLLYLLGAMLPYSKEPVTPSPKRGTLTLFRVFSSYKGKCIFPLFPSVLYMEVIR